MHWGINMDIGDRLDFMDQIQDGKIPVDYNGHFYSLGDDVYVKDYVEGMISGSYLLHKGEKTDIVNVSILFHCPQCCQPLKIQYDGSIVKILDPCPYPQGYPAYTFELNVPSGKMVVGNDFRDIFPVIEEYAINYAFGCQTTSDAYASVGLAHAYVGNSCPSVYRKNKSTLFVGNKLSQLGKRVAGICTDLWWYSIADYDEYIRRGGDHTNVEVINVHPGLYQFTHQKHLLKDDYLKAEIYTYINRIGDPLPLVDYKSQWDSLNFTAGRILHALEKNELENDVIGNANYLMMVNGNGAKCHPNGWITCNRLPDADDPEVEIPVFDEAYRWYPLCDYSAICCGVQGSKFDSEIRLNSSFVALATNILQCIIRHGCLELGKEEPKLKSEMVGTAKDLLKKYIAKYPTEIPDNIKCLVES